MKHQIQVVDSTSEGIPFAKITTPDDKVLALTDDKGYIEAELPELVKITTFYSIPQTIILKPGINIVKLKEKTFELQGVEIIGARDPQKKVLMWLYIFIVLFILYNIFK